MCLIIRFDLVVGKTGWRRQQAAALAAAMVFGIGWTYLSRYLVIGYTFDASKVLWAMAFTPAGSTFLNLAANSFYASIAGLE